MKSRSSTGMSSRRLRRTMMTIGISRPRLRIMLMSAAALATEAALAPVTHHPADGGVRLHADRRILDAPRPHRLEAPPLDRRHDLLDAHAFEIVRIEVRRAHQHG